MKKNIRKVLIIFLVVISIVSLNNIRYVKADSGWDTSYDSGGSWDSGSSWDTSYDSGGSWDSGSSWDYDSDSSSYHSSSYSGEFDLVSFIIAMLFILGYTIVPIIIITISAKKKAKVEQERQKNISELNQPLIEKEIKELFNKIDEAYMNFDYDKLKSLVSINIYKKCEDELLLLKSKNEQRIIDNINIHSFKIINYIKEKELLTVLMSASLYDYTINKDTNNIIKGYSDKKVFNNYRCIFKKINDNWILDTKYLINTYQVNNYRQSQNEEISNEQIKDILPDLNIDKFKEEAYDKFIKIQEAWMNFDYDKLRELCNDNIYNTYYEELEALKLKDGQNIMNDFTKIEDKIINVNKNNDIVTIDYYLDVKFYDYVIDTKTNKIIKGNDKNKIHNIYILKFTMTNNKQNNTCPNCGAKIKDGTVKCEHCKAVIVKDSNNFVMSEKRKIG